MAYDGEDFFPEEFLQKVNEYTREEEALTGKAKQKGKDGKVQRVSAQEEANSVRRSFALENMTEQLQGNMLEEENPGPAEIRHLMRGEIVEDEDDPMPAEGVDRIVSREVYEMEAENELENSQTFLNQELGLGRNHQLREASRTNPHASNGIVDAGFESDKDQDEDDDKEDEEDDDDDEEEKELSRPYGKRKGRGLKPKQGFVVVKKSHTGSKFSHQSDTDRNTKN